LVWYVVGPERMTIMFCISPFVSQVLQSVFPLSTTPLIEHVHCHCRDC
jgi:hypothetical protein